MPGITREVVIALAAKSGIPLLEQAVTLNDLKHADEVWVSSSTKEVLPVTLLDGSKVGSGLPGPIWQQIDVLYQQYKKDVAAWH